MAMIISKDGKNAKKVERSKFEQEDYLQQYIYSNPESIPLYDMKEDIKLLILSREFNTEAGSIDAVGVDQEGEIYLIETKLYKNPDKRRVVAQVLDYGASLWHSTDAGEFMTQLESHVTGASATKLRERLSSFFRLEDDAEALVDSMRQNFSNGAFRFIVLMDSVPSQLKKLVLFINQNSKFDLFAVEMEYYKHEGYEIVIPKLYGADAKKGEGVSHPSKERKWDERSFLEDAEKRLGQDGPHIDAVKELFSFSNQKADEMIWGKGGDRGSFNPKFRRISQRSLYKVYSDGTLQLNFPYLDDNETAERYRHQFARELSKLKRLTLPENCEQKFPNIPVNKWAPALDDFKLVVQQLLNE
jgi:hypothetical protein